MKRCNYGGLLVLMNDINKLLKKYKPYTLNKAERVSKTYKANMDKARNNYNKNQMIKEIGDEYNLNELIIEKTNYIVNRIGNLKLLHQNAPQRKIIACILCFSIFEEDTSVRLDKISVWRGEDLDWRLFSRVTARLLIWYRRQIGIAYTPPEDCIEY